MKDALCYATERRRTRMSWRKYYFDFNYFQTIDTSEKAYWLGFMYADGSVRNNTLRVGLITEAAKHGRKAIGVVKVKRFYQEPTWWWGLFWGFILGIPASYIASWLWVLFPLK